MALTGHPRSAGEPWCCSAETSQRLLGIWREALTIVAAAPTGSSAAQRVPFGLTTRDVLMQGVAAHQPLRRVVLVWRQLAGDLGGPMGGTFAAHAAASLYRHRNQTDVLAFVYSLGETDCGQSCLPVLADMLRAMHADSDHLATLQIYNCLVYASRGLLFADALTLIGCLISLQNNTLLALQLLVDWTGGRLRCSPNSRTFGTVRSVLAQAGFGLWPTHRAGEAACPLGG